MNTAANELASLTLLIGNQQRTIDSLRAKLTARKHEVKELQAACRRRDDLIKALRSCDNLQTVETLRSKISELQKICNERYDMIDRLFERLVNMKAELKRLKAGNQGVLCPHVLRNRATGSS